MDRGRSIVGAVILSIVNGILLGAALATAHPGCYLAGAMGLGTCVNLTYVMAGRLWQERR